MVVSALLGWMVALANVAFCQVYEGVISDFDPLTKKLKIDVSGEETELKLSEFSDVSLEYPGSRDKLAAGRFIEAQGSLSTDQTRFEARTVTIHPISRGLKPLIGKGVVRGALKGLQGQWSIEAGGKSVAVTIPDEAPIAINSPALEYDLKKGRRVWALVTGEGDLQYVKTLRILVESPAALQTPIEEKAAAGETAPEGETSATKTAEEGGTVAAQEPASPLWRQREALTAAARGTKEGGVERSLLGSIEAAEPSSRTYLLKSSEEEFLLRAGSDTHVYIIRPANAADLAAGRTVEVTGSASEGGGRIVVTALKVIMPEKDAQSLARPGHVAGVLTKGADGLSVKTDDRVIRLELGPDARIEQIVPATAGRIKQGSRVRAWGLVFDSVMEAAGVLIGPAEKKETTRTEAAAPTPGTSPPSKTPSPAKTGLKGKGKGKGKMKQQEIPSEGFIIK